MHVYLQNGSRGLSLPQTSNQGLSPPPLICTQDYVHNNLLIEVVIMLICAYLQSITTLLYVKLIAITKVLIEQNAFFQPYTD